LDDILVFANSGLEVAQIFDRFVNAVGEVGLRLNVDNTVILTNEAQQPSTRVTVDCFILKIGPESPAKWLGSVQTACGNMMQQLLSHTTWNIAHHGPLLPVTLIVILLLSAWCGSPFRTQGVRSHKSRDRVIPPPPTFHANARFRIRLSS